MAITGGVRNIVGYLQLDAGNVPVTRCEAAQTKTRSAGTFSATVPIDGLPSGVDETYFVGTVNGGVAVSTLPDGSDLTPLVTGTIDLAEFDYGTRIMTVHGRDNSAALHSQKSSEKFLNQTPQQVIQTVAQRAGLTANINVSSSLQAGKINQIEWAKMTEDTSLASVVHKMSEFLGAHWYVQGSTLNVVDSSADSGGYVVNYTPPQAGGPAAGDFLTMRITRNLPLSQNLTSQVSGWHSQKKQVITSSKTLSGQGGMQTYKYQIPNVEQDHADKHASSSLTDQARHEISVSVELVGDPTIDISQGLQLNGTNGFDQQYDIDSINHVIGDHGYTMMIEAKSMAQGRSISDSSDSATSGVAGASIPLPITGVGHN